MFYLIDNCREMMIGAIFTRCNVMQRNILPHGILSSTCFTKNYLKVKIKQTYFDRGLNMASFEGF